jgi:hypothetical protein
VKHYLLDFSATLGAYEWPVAPHRVGHEYMFDGDATGKRFISLGFWKRPWETQKIEYPNEVGYFSAELFEPEKWKPSFPNLAFEQMDDSDAYWGAKIVTAFTNDTIRRIAAEGKYVRDEATRYVYETLIRRRDAIGKYWLNRITPLEEPQLQIAGDGYRLRFRDLAYERGHNDLAARTYRFWIETLDGDRVSDYRMASAPALDIIGLTQLVAKYPGGPPDKYGRTPMLRILVQSNQRGGEWALPSEVFIGRSQGNLNLQVLGWSHAPKKVSRS